MPVKKGQKYNIEPKPRIKAAFDKIVGNCSTEKQALLDAGYKPKTARRPTVVKNTKSWAILMERYMPDEKLAKVHNEGLEAVSKDGEKDYATRHKYLDTAYKIKNKYPNTIVNAFQFNFGSEKKDYE